MVFVHSQLSVAGQSHFEPLQRPGRGTMLHHAVRVEHGAVTGTMEALVALEISHRAAQVRADGIGYRETLLTVAEDEDLFFRKKRGRAEREIRRVADLEGLRRLVKHARRQKPDHRSQAHADGGTQGDQARGAPTEEGSALHALLHLRVTPRQKSLPTPRGYPLGVGSVDKPVLLTRIPPAPAAPGPPW